jgi:hypothetical protein
MTSEERENKESKVKEGVEDQRSDDHVKREIEITVDDGWRGSG